VFVLVILTHNSSFVTVYLIYQGTESSTGAELSQEFWFVETELKVSQSIMFDEDLFNVFNETSSSAEKSGSKRESGSSGGAGSKSKYREEKGNAEKADNKRYEHYLIDYVRE